MIDDRIVKIGIEVGGVLKVYEGLDCTASGTKFANANQNECEVKISNLDRATREYLLSEASPFKKSKTPRRLTVDVGRKSTGTFRLFSGDISAVTISQPPDITLTIKSLSADALKGDVVARKGPAQERLSDRARKVADDLQMPLNWQASDKSIANYSHSGANLKQVDKLGAVGKVDAYVDDGVLVVKDSRVPLLGRTRILNLDTGMIGIPEPTEHGIKIRFLLDSQTALGGSLDVTSLLYPALNGRYVVYKLGFEVASRDTPFYYDAEALR